MLLNLGLENRAEEEGEGIWMNVLDDEQQKIPDPIAFYAELLTHKLPELINLGIDKADIRLEWLYEYEGQCNLELSPGQLAALGKMGLAEFAPKVDELEIEGEDLLTSFSKHHFPDNTPHRHLYFFDEFKQNSEYIAFGGNANYNEVYVVEKKTGKVLVFSEEEQFMNSCAESFASFLEAFIVLIKLDIELGRKKKVEDPRAVLDAAIAVAGGEAYRAFYAFIFPISDPEPQSQG